MLQLIILACEIKHHLLLTGLLLACLLFIPPVTAADLQPYNENPSPPPLELRDLLGRPHSLVDYRGKVVLVNFWAGWCHPCLQEIPELLRLAEMLADRPFVILAVNVGEEKQKLAGFVKKMDALMVILLDTKSTAFENWKGIGLPSTFVLDPAGHIHYEAYGPVNWDRPDVVAAITVLMNDPATEAGMLQE